MFDNLLLVVKDSSKSYCLTPEQPLLFWIPPGVLHGLSAVGTRWLRCGKILSCTNSPADAEQTASILRATYLLFSAKMEDVSYIQPASMLPKSLYLLSGEC